MILECDIGNTAAKWRLLGRDGRVVQRGRAENWREGMPSLPESPVERVRGLCVAGDEAKTAFARHVQVSYGRVVEWASTAPVAAGVTCAYDDVTRLGIDRWCAAIAAFNQAQSAVLVIDAGSALTVDAVNAGGQHLGGYIVPGEALMKRALLADTERVRFEPEVVNSGLAFGGSTDSAVHAGVRAAQLGVARVAIAQAAEVMGDYSLYLTGGASSQLSEALSAKVEHNPELVLDGLSWLLP